MLNQNCEGDTRKSSGCYSRSKKRSPTFGRHESFILSSENKSQLFIPKGFAHGFLTLSVTTIFSYKVDNPYSPDHEIGIKYDDEFLNIKWDYHRKIILSKKDKTLNSFYTKIFNFKWKRKIF